MNKPKLCLECKYYEKDKDHPWRGKCFNYKVISSDPWALANNYEGKPYGVSCLEERRNKSFFAKCGIKGKLWEPKNEK